MRTKLKQAKKPSVSSCSDTIDVTGSKVAILSTTANTPPVGSYSATPVVVEPRRPTSMNVEPSSYTSIHDMLRIWATTPDLLVKEDLVSRISSAHQGEVTETNKVETVTRRLSVKERIDAAKAGVDYFSPKLKAVEQKLSNDVNTMSDVELLDFIKSLSNQEE